jgi:HK97 gp10 family phage protein
VAEAVEIDAAAFQEGAAAALKDFDVQAARIVLALGDKIVSTAEALVPHGVTGVLEGSIGSEPGRNERGPYVDVGTSDPVGFYQEFGTSKMAAHPFMRPALAQAGAELRTMGGSVHRLGRRGVTSIARRARARQALRRAVRTGKITPQQAGQAQATLRGLQGRGLRLRRLRIG